MKETLSRLAAVWKTISLKQRVLLVVVTIGLCVAVTVTIRWARETSYTTRHTSLSAEEAGEIADTHGLDETQGELDVTSRTRFYYDLGKKVLWGLLVLWLFFYLYKLLRQIGQIVSAAPVRGPATARGEEEAPKAVAEPSQTRLTDSFCRHAREHPDEVARIIKTMMRG